MANPDGVQLATRRLRLEPLSGADLDLFHDTNTDAFVRRFLWDNETIPESVSRDLLEAVQLHFAHDGWGLWKLIARDDCRYLGYAGLWTFFDEPQPQLLYALHEQHAGHGYATEAAGAVLEYALGELGFSYLLASMDEANTASARVCERLAMERIEQRLMDGKPTLFYRATP